MVNDYAIIHKGFTDSLIDDVIFSIIVCYKKNKFYKIFRFKKNENIKYEDLCKLIAKKIKIKTNNIHFNNTTSLFLQINNICKYE